VVIDSILRQRVKARIKIPVSFRMYFIRWKPGVIESFDRSSELSPVFRANFGLKPL
jgi:hypothetical protein